MKDRNLPYIAVREPVSASSALRFTAAQLSPFLSQDEKRSDFTEQKERVDWDKVCQVLRAQRLLGAAHATLGKCDWADQVPPELRLAWSKAWSATWGHARRRLPRLRHVLAVCREIEVPVMVMKGPVFVERLYTGDFGRRSSRDFDLVIHPDHVIRFIDGLQGVFGDALNALLECTTNRYHFRIGCAVFETHWNLSLFYAFNRASRRADRQDGIWNRSEEIEFGWGRCLCMSWADMLVHQAGHAVIQHDLKFDSLLLVLDFAHTIMAMESSVSAEFIKECAREQGYPTALEAMVMAVRAMVPGSEASPLLAALHSVGRPGLTARVLRQIGDRREAPAKAEVLRVFDMTITMAHFMDGWDNRAGFLRQILFPSRYTLTETYHESFTRFRYAQALVLHLIMLPLFVPAIWILFTGQLREFWAYVVSRHPVIK